MRDHKQERSKKTTKSTSGERGNSHKYTCKMGLPYLYVSDFPLVVLVVLVVLVISGIRNCNVAHNRYRSGKHPAVSKICDETYSLV